MCGIVGAIGERNVTGILITGLKRLEYRGYDSAGLAVICDSGLQRVRREGKVQGLEDATVVAGTSGQLGIAHTRWATHGKPSEANAHPHMSGDGLAVVHNGIIENYQALRDALTADGYRFTSETDTEVVVHLIHKAQARGLDLLAAVQDAVRQLHGAYALGIISKAEPDRLIAVRRGSPLVVGLGIGENYVASDQLALLPVTTRFIFMQEGDLADVRREGVQLYDADGQPVTRRVHEFDGTHEDVEKGEYRHFMLKEIFEQPAALQRTLEGRVTSAASLDALFAERRDLLGKVRNVQIIACGTSYHAGMVARYWLEDLAQVPCQVEVASEFRYRDHVVPEGTLLITISQSGETADTLAALRGADSPNYVGRLTVCNVDSSSLVRESELALLTRAGPEIGVASTKAFTTQLAALLVLVLALGRARGSLAEDRIEQVLADLRTLPSLVEKTLGLDRAIETLSRDFVEKHHTLFLGRGTQFPVAMEGALKLKEISYIHAEAYPAGELKHGPLALVDKDMPVVAVAPNDELLEKLKSNLQEVRARGGRLYLFADSRAALTADDGVSVLTLPDVPEYLAPILYTVPLQLLSYHVAVMRGTDVDQPRNLAKSVTVE
ncbi:MAG: glutamine--fructose-6-phosphate transaminase (isomerizing) [Alcanivorax sp.]|nr:glutamine--fructose-6-phosphate transaminase (isomerizing) [Alcanivorax sp.]